MNEAYPLPNLLEFAFLFLTAFVPVNLPTLTTMFYTLSVLYFIPYLHAI